MSAFVLFLRRVLLLRLLSPFLSILLSRLAEEEARLVLLRRTCPGSNGSVADRNLLQKS